MTVSHWENPAVLVPFAAARLMASLSASTSTFEVVAVFVLASISGMVAMVIWSLGNEIVIPGT